MLYTTWSYNSQKYDYKNTENLLFFDKIDENIRMKYMLSNKQLLHIQRFKVRRIINNNLKTISFVYV